MRKNLRNRLLTVLGVVALAIFFAFPIQKRINLGLDLKGGMHLILRVKTETLSADAKKDAVERAIEILRNRIDSMGVGETVIQKQGDNAILIQLPGVTDRDAAIRLIGTTAKLEFHIVEEDPNLIRQALEGTVPEGYLLKTIKKDDNTPILIDAKVALSGEAVADAKIDFDQSGFGQPHIALKFDADGAKQFATITRRNVGNRLAIVLDNQVLSAPNINEPILGGNAQITGQFTIEEANTLALSLRSGALPVDMVIEEERTIGPLLGKDSIRAGFTATIIGALLVFAFMFIYYLKAGVISNIALALNLLLLFGIMGFLNMMLPESQLTLTLPGIAGIILTLGMAVDANVLINERIREELSNGRSMKAAINSGFSKALKAIIDSNTTTLIAAFMLFQFGSGPIKGFAVTLTIGLVSSLFTALFVTRTLFDLFFEWNMLNKLPMLSFFGEAKINFVKIRYICFALSAVMCIASITTWVQKQDTAYGIDFAGGQILEYHFTQAVSADAIRDAIKAIGLENAVIQTFKEQPENVIIRTSIEDKLASGKDDNSTKVMEAFSASFPNNPVDILRIEQVGPVVGKNLRAAALLAIIFALIGILLYVGLRFKHFDFATAGIIALIHDVVITLGIILMMGRQVDLLVVTALLTIAGYSINDTIIIYDRIRENLVKERKLSLAEIINLSINQTLGRTILTTITTLLVVITLFLKGGEVLNTFALCLMIGFVAGTYSTIFIASPLVLAWDKKKPNKK